jgi:uncharacterized membrane protein YgaE (UPF0421/DUF939 family)
MNCGVHDDHQSSGRLALSAWFVRVRKLRPGIVDGHQLIMAAKAALGAGVAWEVTTLAHPHGRPYLAPIAVVLIVQPTVYDSVSRAFQRVVGVVLGVAVGMIVSGLLEPNSWSIGIIIFAGLVLGWTARLSPQGVVQIPVTALLVFVVGSITPTYAGERLVDTVIGGAIAVVVVLSAPSRLASDAIPSEVLEPLRQCAAILRAMAAGLHSPWTAEQAAAWLGDAHRLVHSITVARQGQEARELDARWNKWAQRERPTIERAEQALRTGEQVGIRTTAITQAVVDDSGGARPMPELSAMLMKTAEATEAYTTWVVAPASPDSRARLVDTVRAAAEDLAHTLTTAQQSGGGYTSAGLSFGVVCAMTQQLLAEIGRCVDWPPSGPIQSDPATAQAGNDRPPTRTPHR